MPGDPSFEGIRALFNAGLQPLNKAITDRIQQGRESGPMYVPGTKGMAGPPIDAANAVANAAEFVNPIPANADEAAFLAAVPGAKTLKPVYRQAIAKFGKRAKAANVAQMSTQEALIWSHDQLRAGIRVRSGATPTYHHARTGETHADMMRRLQKNYGLKKKDMEPVIFHDGNVLELQEGMEMGRALGVVLKGLRDPKFNPAAGQPRVKPRPGARPTQGPQSRATFEDPRAVEREIRTGAGPAGEAATARGKGDIVGAPVERGHLAAYRREAARERDPNKIVALIKKHGLDPNDPANYPDSEGVFGFDQPRRGAGRSGPGHKGPGR